MRRVSPSMAVALLALFVALGGTGLAASHYIITSTKQIKPTVLRKLRGSEGPPGPQGPQGETGAIGPAGARGAEANIAQLCIGIGEAWVYAAGAAGRASGSGEPEATEALQGTRYALETLFIRGGC